MHDVFISYSHKDKYIADAICANLEANAIKCWYAPRNIVPGMEWSEAIMHALTKAKVFVLIFSKYSNCSDQVYNEITSAIKYGCHIIPFCVDSIEMEVRLAYYLNAVHWLDATDASLLDSIEKLYNETYTYLHHHSPKSFVKVPVRGKKRHRWHIFAGAIAVLLAFLLVFAVKFIADGADTAGEYVAEVGDIIEFGTLADDPIEWKVLTKEGERLLVVSREGLFSDFYNMYGGICTWESCTLRSTLNSQYYDLWFTDKEKENIFETHLANPGNTLYGTDGGHATRDKLFILNADEILEYLPDKADRKLMASASLGNRATAYSPWWVRNPGENLDCALYVDENGNVGYDISENMIMGSGNALAGCYLVRPAMWIKYDGPAKENAPASSDKIDYSLLCTAKEGEIVQFGRYEQDNNTRNGKENIDWIVLETADYSHARMLTLISKDCLDSVNITVKNHGYNLWYDCTARSWLNDTFYPSAFDATERQMMQPILLESEDKFEPASQPVKTSDNVVLLSLEQYNQFAHILSVSTFSCSTYASEKESGLSGWWLTDTHFTDFSPDANYIVNQEGEVETAMQKFNQYVRPVISIMTDIA